MTDQANWIAEFPLATTPAGFSGGFRRVERQNDGEAATYSPDPPFVTAPGPLAPERCIELRREPGVMRHEVTPPLHKFVVGSRVWFRFDFALGDDFKLSGTTGWGPIISQVHQEDSNGSPPLYFEITNGELRLGGGDDKQGTPVERMRWNARLGPVASNNERGPFLVTPMRWYTVVFGAFFSNVPGVSTVEAWVGGTQVLANFFVPGTLIYPGNSFSFWKGATYYGGPDTAPGTVYQKKHRWGATRAAVS